MCAGDGGYGTGWSHGEPGNIFKHGDLVGFNMGLSWHYHGIYIFVAMVINMGIENGYHGI